MYDSPPVDRIPGNSGPGEAARLRAAALRLAAEMDKAGLYPSAAHAAMAADAVAISGGTGGEAELPSDVELEFEADEHGRVWMIRDGDCHIIGRVGAVSAEMRRFLAALLLGERDRG